MLNKLKNKIRYSQFHFFLLKFTNPKYIEWINKEIIFHSKFLDKNNIIFDLGANLGDKTHIFSKFANKVIAYEPADKMNSILKDRFKKKNIIIKNKIVSEKIGLAKFFIIDDNEAYSTIIPKSLKYFKHLDKQQIRLTKKKSTTLNNEIKKIGLPDYIKIDCEGAEKLILKDLYYKVPIISFELNLPQFYKEGENIVKNFEKKFNSKFNIRIHEKYNFTFKNNINSKSCINFLKKKKLVVEIFIFS